MKDENLNKNDIGQRLSYKQREVIERIKKRRMNVVNSKSFEISFRCSKTNRDFIVFLEKKGNDRYMVIKISRGRDEHYLSGIGNKAESSNVNNAKKEEIGMDMIENIEDIVCPYCGSRTIVKCGCGGLGCGGSLVNDGNRNFYKCPWCGGSGYVMGSFDKIKGSITKEKLFLKGERRNLLQREERKKIERALGSGK